MKTINYGSVSGYSCEYFFANKTSNEHNIKSDFSYFLAPNHFLSGGLTNGGTVTFKWIDNIILNGPGFFRKNCQ